MELRNLFKAQSRKTEPVNGRPAIPQERRPHPSLEIPKEAFLARLPEADRINVELIASEFTQYFGADRREDAILVVAGGAVDPRKPLPRKDIDCVLVIGKSTLSPSPEDASLPKPVQEARSYFRKTQEFADAINAHHEGHFSGRDDIPPQPDPEYPDLLHDQDGVIRLHPPVDRTHTTTRPMTIELVTERVRTTFQENLNNRIENGQPFTILARIDTHNGS